MRALFCAIIIALGLSATAEAQWLSKNGGLDTARSRAMHFISSTTGFAVGDTNSFYKTTDGGERWTKLDPLGCGSCPVNYHRVAFLSPTIGFVWGRDTSRRAKIVLATEDGGDSWHLSDSMTADVTYLSETFGYDIRTYGSWNTEVRITTDLGRTWSQVYRDEGLPYYTTVADIRGAFGDTLNAVIYDLVSISHIGYEGKLFKGYTTDGGKKWHSSILQPTRFTPAGNFRWFGWRGDTIVRSDDGGKNWPAIAVPGYTFGFAPLTYDVIYGVIGNSPYVTRSNDGGLNWSKDYVADTLGNVRAVQRFASNGLETIYMLASGTSWPGARVFKRTNAISAVAETEQATSIGVILDGNILKVISCDMPALVDVAGRRIDAEPQRSETDRWHIDVAGLRAGVYFVRVGEQSLKILIR